MINHGTSKISKKFLFSLVSTIKVPILKFSNVLVTIATLNQTDLLVYLTHKFLIHKI